MQEIQCIGIDWIPHDVLSAMVNKADSLNKEHHSVMPQNNETVVVPSKSNPRDSHVVNLFANGKAECAKCPGFAAFSVCAHTLAACLAIDRLKDFLSWLVSTKRNSGGINLSAAVAYGMPKGRGRKGERAPRKRSVGNKKPVSKVVSRVTLGYNGNDGFQPHSVSHNGQALSQQSSNLLQSGQTQYPASKRFVGPTASNQYSPNSVFQASLTSPQLTQFFVQPQSTSQGSFQSQVTPQTSFFQPQGTSQASFQPQVTSQTSFQPQMTPQTSFQPQVTPQTSFPPQVTPQMSFQTYQPHHQLNIPCFPSPGQGQFIVYLLQYCPTQTSVCFGCGNTLKPNASIPPPPGDLVIVSKMAREWTYQGRLYRKPSNVYFHCNVQCVQRKQPNFDGRSSFVNLDVEPLLTYVHKQFLRNHLEI